MKATGVLNDSQYTPSVSAREVHLLDLLTILAYRRKFIFWFTSGAAVVTAVVVLLIPNKYTAAAVVLPPSPNPSMSSTMLGQWGGSGTLASFAAASMGIRNPGEIYVSFFRSRTVEDALIQRFGLMTRYHRKNAVDARQAFEAHSTAALGAKDGLIRVTVTDRDPGFAAQLANAWVEEFRKHSDSMTISEASQRRAFFQQQLLEANENLAKAEEELKNTQQSTGVLQLDSQARALIESAAELRAQITAQEVQLQAMHTYATADNPQYELAQEQLNALKDQLTKVAGAGADAAGATVSQGHISQAGIAYTNAIRDVHYYETVEELLARQFEAAKLDEARQGSIQISDVAVPPDKKSSPKRAIITLAGTALGLIAACMWVLFAFGLDRLMQNPLERRRLDDLRSALRRR